LEQANLDALEAAFALGGGSAEYSYIETAVGPTCGACVFTAKSADRSRFELDYCLDVACPQPVVRDRHEGLQH